MHSNDVLETKHRTSRGPATSLGEGWAVLVALMLAILVVTIDNTVLNVALPSISSDLDANTSELQWIVNAYSLLFGGLLLMGGSVADRLGRRRILLAGLVAFGSTSALVLLVRSATELIVLRGLSGAAAAFLMPATVALMYRAFEGPARAKAIGIAGAGAAFGFALGPVLGGALLQAFSWQSVFLINVPIVLIALPVARAVISPDGDRAGGTADVVGGLLSVLAMGGLVAALIDGPDRGWTSVGVLAPAIGALAAAGGFVRWELRAAHPMVDLRMIARRGVAGPGAVQAALMFAVAGLLFLLTQLLQVLDGYSPIAAGLRSVPVAVGLIGGGPVLTSGARRLGTSGAAALGLLITATGLGGVAFAIDHSYVVLAAGLLIVGVGVRVTITIAALAVLDGLPNQAAGIGAALGDTFQEIGGALGVALLGSVFNAIYRSDLPAGTPSAARSSLHGALTLHNPSLSNAARHAFTTGAQTALIVCAATLAAAAILASLTVPSGLDVTDDPATAAAMT